MTRIATPRLIPFAGAAALALGLLSLSQGASASATSKLQRCLTDSLSTAISCCEKATMDHRPFWMMQANAQCTDVVRCSGRRCYVQKIWTYNEDSRSKGGRGRGNEGKR